MLEGEERMKAGQLVLDTLESLARRRRLPVHFPYVMPQLEPETTLLLTERGYHLSRDFPVCYLDIEWDSFEGYLGHLRSFSRKMRRNVKEERNRFKRAGLVIKEIDDLSPYGTRLHALVNEVYLKHRNANVPFTTSFLATLKHYLGENAVFYGAFLEGDLIGFVLLLKKGGAGYLPWMGIDWNKTGNEATYFNLVYYRPIEDAIAQGLKRLYFGKALYRTKVRRGCRTLDLGYYYKGSSATRHAFLRPWFAFHSAWMKRRMTDIEDLDQLRRHQGN